MLEDGTPVDPASVTTMVPRWKQGDELYAGRRKYRVLAVDEMPVGDEIQGALVVAPLD